MVKGPVNVVSRWIPLVVLLLLLLPMVALLVVVQSLSSSSFSSSHRSVLGYDNGLGRTPPMGWNSWNRFHCDIEETLIKETAQAMVDLGLDQVGYRYINLDDCWQQLHRNATSYNIQEDLTKFPSGIPALSDFVHSLGLKFGLYSDAGLKTCAGRPGSLGFERQDAAIYASWNIDYLKYDNCFNVGMDVHVRYQRMHDALNETGHPIFFSLCEWGYKDPATWAAPVGNSWRTTTDIQPNWKSITTLLDLNNQWYEYAGPGGWNDPDMLEVGNGDLTVAEQRAHFTLWCLMKSPLLLGNDLRNLSDEVLDIIANDELIAWNQDSLGKQGYKRAKMVGNQVERWTGEENEDLEVWAGDLSGGNVAVVLFNRSSKAQNITALWKDIGLSQETKATIRDVWLHREIGTFQSNFTSLVGSHDVVAIQLSPIISTSSVYW